MMTIVKSHRFPVTAQWKEGRLTEITAAGRPDLDVATPPEFKGGIEGVWSPEELLVGSLASCFAVTFVAIAERVPVTFDALRVDGVGHVERRTDGRVGFVSIEVNVHAEVPERHVHDAEVAARRAKELCIVSLALEVPLELELEIIPSRAPAATPALTG
jgi:organic hydroperoxide reductase OsmC/OhrA